MNKICLILMLIVSAVGVTHVDAADLTAASPKPNVIFILADDMGYFLAPDCQVLR